MVAAAAALAVVVLSFDAATTAGATTESGPVQHGRRSPVVVVSSAGCTPNRKRTLIATRYPVVHPVIERFVLCWAASFISQGARLALLRMVREMQACLPSSKSPLLQCQSRADEERPLASCDSGLDEVQRKHLRVGAAALLLKRHLFRYQGTVSAALVLGGVDVIGEHIYQARMYLFFSASGLSVGLISVASAPGSVFH